MKIIPAIVMLPLREDVLELAWKLKAVVPLPFPGVPEVTVIHAAFDVAVQLHPAGAVTLTELVPAVAPTPVLRLDRLNVHPAAA